MGDMSRSRARSVAERNRFKTRDTTRTHQNASQSFTHLSGGGSGYWTGEQQRARAMQCVGQRLMYHTEWTDERENNERKQTNKMRCTNFLICFKAQYAYVLSSFVFRFIVRENVGHVPATLPHCARPARPATASSASRLSAAAAECRHSRSPAQWPTRTSRARALTR